MTTELSPLSESFQDVRPDIQYGLTHAIAEQLVRLSGQEHIKRMTPEDTDKFATINMVDKWYDNRFDTKKPLLAWIGTAANELAGIAWIENAQPYIKNRGKQIFGLRVYEGFENQGIGSYLGQDLHATFDKTKGTAYQTSFRMLSSNNAAFSVAAVKLNYKNEGGDAYRGIQHYVRSKK